MLRSFLVSLWFLWFYCYLSLKGVFFLLWFLISFAKFHTFTYFFICFFVLLNFFFFFWLLVFFVPLVLCLPFFFFFNAQIEIVFFMHNRYSIRYKYTSILSHFKYQTIPCENIFWPGIFTLHTSYIFFFKVVTKILKQKFPIHSLYYAFWIKKKKNFNSMKVFVKTTPKLNPIQKKIHSEL